MAGSEKTKKLARHKRKKQRKVKEKRRRVLQASVLAHKGSKRVGEQIEKSKPTEKSKPS